MAPPSSPVSDAKHVAFLSYWLNTVIFCRQSLQMQPPTSLWLLCFMKNIDFAWQSWLLLNFMKKWGCGDQASTGRLDQSSGPHLVFTTIGQHHLSIFPLQLVISKSSSRHRQTSTPLSSSRCSKKYSSDRWILLFFQTPSSALFLRHKGFTLSPYSDRMAGPSWFTCSRIALIPFD